MSDNSTKAVDPTRLARLITWLRTWCKQPTQVASVCPSSKALTRALADRSCIRAATIVVELGPGTGETTKALLEQMRPDAILLAIEKTAEFIEPLQRLGDPRLIVENADAAQVGQLLEKHRLPQPTVVVSGIPFSYTEPAAADNIVQAIHAVLPHDATLITYQLRQDVYKYCFPLFGQPTIERVFWNLPPVLIHTWKKSIPQGPQEATDREPSDQTSSGEALVQ